MSVTQTTGTTPGIRWAVAARPLNPDSPSGDVYAVAASESGTLVAVIDGLGHGPPARRAAMRARDTLEDGPQNPADLIELFRRCHRACRSTRGVVMSACWFSSGDSGIEYLGVGDVTAVVLHGDDRQTPRRQMTGFRGIIGASLPDCAPRRQPVGLGDRIVLATDGVDRKFRFHITPTEESITSQAHELLDRFATDHDDALVLVAAPREEAPL